MQAAVLLISQNDYEQVEEYRGARDLHSLKEFVVLMKARVGATVDIIDEHVPEYSTPEEDEPVDDGDEEEEEEEDEEEAEKPAQVWHLSCIQIFLIMAADCLFFESVVLLLTSDAYTGGDSLSTCT